MAWFDPAIPLIATKCSPAKVKTRLCFATVRLQSEPGNWLYGLLEALMASVRLTAAIIANGRNRRCLPSLPEMASLMVEEHKSIENACSPVRPVFQDLKQTVGFRPHSPR